MAPKGAALIVVGESDGGAAACRRHRHGRRAHTAPREIEKAEVDLGKMDAKLANPQFLAKAKDEAIEEARERKAELLETIRRLAAAVKRIEAAA